MSNKHNNEHHENHRKMDLNKVMGNVASVATCVAGCGAGVCAGFAVKTALETVAPPTTKPIVEIGFRAGTYLVEAGAAVVVTNMVTDGLDTMTKVVATTINGVARAFEDDKKNRLEEGDEKEAEK